MKLRSLWTKDVRLKPVRRVLKIYNFIIFQCVARHFKTIPIVEKEALTFFIYMIKTSKSKLDRERRDPMDTD